MIIRKRIHISGRRRKIIIDTKIKYIKVLDKLYEVEKISFFNFSVQAKETEKTIDDVPAEEVFDLTDFKDFKITLRNWHGNVVDFMEYMKNRERNALECP